MQYPAWRTAFNTIIRSRNIPASEAMYYLKKYLTGAAKELVDGYFYFSKEQSFNEAMKLLDERFGDPFKVADAFRTKLDEWRKIPASDSEGLRQLADFLRQCHMAMSQVDTLHILDDERENQKILQKLPDWLVTRWARQVQQWREQARRYPPFIEFANFMKRESDLACDPVASLQALRKGQTTPKKIATPKAAASRTLTTQSKECSSNSKESAGSKSTQRVQVKEFKDNVKKKDYTSRPCQLCSKTGHLLGDCFAFLEKPLVDRKTFVQENGLCFGCLKKGHRHQDCSWKQRCDTCSRRHPTALHEDWTPPDKDKKRQDKDKEPKEETKTSSFRQSSAMGTALGTTMIVPIWLSAKEHINREILTYAILDNQSDSTLVTEALATRLNSHMTPVRLRVKTLTTPCSIPEQSNLVDGLVIRGMNQRKRITIPKAYTRDVIPGEMSQVPTPQLAEDWSHLRHIAPDMPDLQDCDIGLLVGTNCPAAGIPREVLAGKDDEPYAIRTDLGWSIVKGSGS